MNNLGIALSGGSARGIAGIDKFGLFDFNQAENIYQLGYEYMKSQMQMIKKAILASEKQ